MPCPRGTGRWGALDKDGRFVPDLTLDVHPYDQDKALRSLELLRIGHSEKDLCEMLDVSLLSLSRWRRENEEFGKEWQIAKEERAETLLEKSYQDDLVASYDEDENLKGVQMKATRSKMAQEYVKTVRPDKLKGIGGSGLTININVDKTLERRAKEFVWETAAQEI